MRAPLTETQALVLRCVIESWRKRLPPTVREICEAAGFRSTNAAAEQIEKLVARRYLRRNSSRARDIEPTPRGMAALAAASVGAGVA